MRLQKTSPGSASVNPHAHDKPIDKLLSRLDRVKRTAPDKWTALCPGHDDHTPSLSIREVEDGKVLLKCWSGCGAAEIVSALGLSLRDLFPGDRFSITHANSKSRVWEYRDALCGIAHEAAVARIITEATRVGRQLSDEDLARLALAEERISDALSLVGGGQ